MHARTAPVIRIDSRGCTGITVTTQRNPTVDFTDAGRNIIAETCLGIEIWVTVAAMYLVMTFAGSLLASVRRRRWRRPYRLERPARRNQAFGNGLTAGGCAT